MVRVRIAVAFVLLIGLGTGCGGSGGSGSVSDISGEYHGRLRVISDTCSDSALPVDDTIGVWHTVNQNGSRVVLDDADGFSYSGELDADGRGFSVSAERFEVVIEGHQSCSALARIEYKGIRKEGADVTTLGTVSCAGATLCTTSWSGTMSRGEFSQ